jgi:hypothetical protein
MISNLIFIQNLKAKHIDINKNKILLTKGAITKK